MNEQFMNSHIVENDMRNMKMQNIDWIQLYQKTVLITGATGMIGSYLVYYLIFLNERYNAGISIILVVRSMEKCCLRFKEYVKKEYFNIIIEDVLDFEQSKIPPKVSFIIHAASLASPQYYGTNPVETILPNVIATYQLLEYAKRIGVESFLFFSSGSVYGAVEQVDSVLEEYYGPLDFLKKGNYYGESKRLGESLCKAYFEEYGVPTKSVRIHHTYAPTMDIKNDKRVFADFINNIIMHQNIVLKSDGKDKRAFCYITDAINGVLKILLNGQDGESYNLGNNREYLSIKELAELLVSLVPEYNLEVVMKKRLSGDEYTPSTEKRMAPVNTKKLEKLGWKPMVDTKNGFSRVLEYWKDFE